MVDFVNTNGFIGKILTGLTTEVTGDITLTLLLIVFVLMLLLALFRVPIEYSVILVMPFLLVCAAFYTGVMPVAGAFLLYLGVLWAKNFVLNPSA